MERIDTHPKKIAGIRASALLEIALYLIVLVAISIVLFDGTRFRTFEPHPFWVIVLLCACQYGTAEGVVAALASTVALLLFNLPDQGIQQNMYDYLFMVAKTPLLWLVAAVGLGELRLKHVRERNTLVDSLDASEARESKITETYQWTRDLKERLELRVAGDLRSTVAAYQAARGMERLTPEGVLRGIEDLTAAVMRPEQCSIYTINGNELTLALSHGWRDSDAYSRRFDSRNELFANVIGARTRLSVINPDHERILAGQGVLAGPIIDTATDNVLGMLKIERLPFAELNLTTLESFGALCEWAGQALANAQKYQTAQKGSIVNPDHNLLTQNYFERHADYITSLARRAGFDVSMLVVRFANAANFGPEARTAVARLLSDTVDQVLRAVDLAFDYQGTSEEYSIVLPATNRSGADVVLGKIRSNLAARLTGNARGAEFSYSIQTLHEQKA